MTVFVVDALPPEDLEALLDGVALGVALLGESLLERVAA